MKLADMGIKGGVFWCLHKASTPTFLSISAGTIYFWKLNREKARFEIFHSQDVDKEYASKLYEAVKLFTPRIEAMIEELENKENL